MNPPERLSIAPPAADKPPMKVNIYRFSQTMNSQLTPMFPYLGEGAIVPTGAVMRGAPGMNMGYFLHFNSVDEIFMCFGSSGGGRYRPGQVTVGARTHGVGGPHDDPQQYSVMVITQRQAVASAQTESIGFVCAKCQEPLFVHEFAVEHATGSTQHSPLATIEGALDAALRFNGDAHLRACAKCGHVNDPFPYALWGWDRYMSNTWVAQKSREALAAAAGSV